MFYAIRINTSVYGVIGIENTDKALDVYANSVLLSILGECALALENEKNAKEKEEARLKAIEEEKKRIANLPKNSEEAVGIKYPWATKVEKVLDGRDGYSYFNVYCGGKHIMLCQRDTGYAEWKRDFDKDFKQLTDGQVKDYLKVKEK
jgi:hypothetical protein